MASIEIRYGWTLMGFLQNVCIAISVVLQIPNICPFISLPFGNLERLKKL